MESLKSLAESTPNKADKKLGYYELLRIGELALSVLSSHRADETTLEYAQSLLQSVLQEFETQVDALTPVSPVQYCTCGNSTATVYDNAKLSTPSVGFTVIDHPWVGSTTTTGTNSSSLWRVSTDDTVKVC